MADKNLEERLDNNCLYSFQSLGSDQEFKKSVNQLPSEAPLGAREPIEYNIFRTGRFKHPFYGDDLDFDQEYLESLVENFRAGVVPEALILNVGHKSDNGEIGAIGTFDDIKLKGGKIDTPLGEKERIFLRARLVLNSKGIELYKDRRYLFSSSEIHPDYTTREKYEISDELEDEGVDEEGDEAQGENYATISHGPTLTGLAATNKPFINNLGQTVDTDGASFSLSEEMQSAKEPQVFSKPVVEDEDGNVQGYSRDTLLFADLNNNKLKNNLVNDNKSIEKNNEESRNYFEFRDADISSDCDESQEVESEDSNSTTSQEKEREFSNKQKEEFTEDNSESEEENTMELSELLNDLEELDLSEQVEKLDDNMHKFSGGNAEIVKQIYEDKKERLQAEKAREEAVSKQQRYKNEKEKLEEKNIELKNEVSEAREGSKTAQINQFRKRLEDEGYTEAAIDVVEDGLMSLSADQFSKEYEFTFSGPEGEEQEKEMNFMGFLDKLFSELQGGPVTEEFSTEEDPSATVDENEKEVNPDAGAEDFDEDEEEVEYSDDLPEKVQKFADRNGWVPREDDWKDINEQGYHKKLEKDKIEG